MRAYPNSSNIMYISFFFITCTDLRDTYCHHYHVNIFECVYNFMQRSNFLIISYTDKNYIQQCVKVSTIN